MYFEHALRRVHSDPIRRCAPRLLTLPPSWTDGVISAMTASHGKNDSRRTSGLPPPEGVVTQTLLIDNYDSYTFNLFQLLAEVNGVEPCVVRNDGVSWEELRHWGFGNVVISPGPGHPARDRDFGVCREVIRSGEAPVLGVCLGHQGIA